MEKRYPSKENSQFIFCDDVRMELGNKPSIMGWYSNNDIIFPSNMKKLIIPFAIIFIAYDGNGEFECELEIENPKGDVNLKKTLGINQKKLDKAMLLINKFNTLEFSEEGIYKIRILLDEKIYERELEITIAE